MPGTASARTAERASLTEGRKFRIPTLREAFERFPGIRFNIEIKQNSPALIDATVRIVAEARREETTLLAAGEDDTMSALRARVAETGLRPALWCGGPGRRGARSSAQPRRAQRRRRSPWRSRSRPPSREIPS